MNRFRHALCLLALLIACRAQAQSAQGRRGAVATVNQVASQAGIDAMKKGGNAVDAAVAAALTLGVVNGFNSGIGGGCFILIRQAGGHLLAIDGRETAPAAATREMFLRHGQPDTNLSQTGPLAAGVPGELVALDLALKKSGRLPLSELLLDAAKIASNGFIIDNHYASVLKEEAPVLRQLNESPCSLLKPDGTPYAEGELCRQPDLARTYQAIAKEGLNWFYDGPFARATENWMRQNHGLITREDFRKYRAILREPISTEYRAYTVVSFPPPSSGGVHVLEILNMLGTQNFADSNFTALDRTHYIAEAMKLAFADRAFWLGDPAFAKVPRGLIDPGYGRELAARIQAQTVIAVAGHGSPADASGDIFGEHTTHVSAADAEGNWVALTATINTHFGCKVVIPGTGVLLNNEMDDFTAAPGATNYFGLTGAEANGVAPGKRPLSSMSPAIVLKDGRPILSVGAAGGPTIVSQTLLTIVDALDLGMNPQEAIDTPKFHHQWKPDVLTVERATSKDIIEGLKQRGHVVRRVNALGAAQAVGALPDGELMGASDRRAGGQAAAW